jgi:hypothetical protein
MGKRKPLFRQVGSAKPNFALPLPVAGLLSSHFLALLP